MKKMMMYLDPHLYAAFVACESSCHVLSILPESDLIDNLRDLIHTQHDLFVCMVEGKHYGTDALDKFLRYNITILEETKRIKEEEG